MKVLFLTQYFPPEIGAPQVRLSELAVQLDRLGHQVTVVTAMPNHPTGKIFPGYGRSFYRKESFKGRIPLHRVWIYPAHGTGLKRMLNYLSFMITSFPILFFCGRPDILLVESPPLFLGLTGWVYSVLRNVTMVFNVADLWPDSVADLGVMRRGILFKVLERIEAFIYRRSDFVAAVTEGIRDNLCRHKHVPASKILFLPNGVNTETFRRMSPDEMPEKKILLYAGTVGIAQGLEVLVDAMRILQTKGRDDLRAVLLGDGSAKSNLQERVRSHGLQNVIFLDPVPLERVAEIYGSACAGFVSLKKLTLFEGARPSKMFPIMACEKPVIYCGAGEGANLVKEARAGIVVEPGNPAQLADAIEFIADHPGDADLMGARGREWVSMHLSWERVARDWLADLSTRLHLRSAAN